MPGESSILRVETAPASGAAHLVEPHLFILARKCAMSSVFFFTVRPKYTSGCGCTSAPVAKRAAICQSRLNRERPNEVGKRKKGQADYRTVKEL